MIKFIELILLVKAPDAIDWKSLGIEKEDGSNYEWAEEFINIFSIQGYYRVSTENGEEQTILNTTIGEVQCKLSQKELIDKIQRAYDEFRTDSNIVYSADRQDSETNTDKGQQATNTDCSDMD